MLYIENTRGMSISVVDEKAMEHIKEVKLVDDFWPDDLSRSPDGKMLYVSGNYKGPHYSDNAYSGKSAVVAVSTESLEVEWVAEIDGEVGHSVLNKKGDKFYVAMFDRWHVVEVDTNTQEVTTFPIDHIGGHGVRLSSDDKKLFVGSILVRELDVVDLPTKKVEQRLYFRDPVRPFHFSEEQGLMFVQVSEFHGFHIVDMKSGVTVNSVNLPELPANTMVEEHWPNTVDHGLEVSPKGDVMCCVATTGGYIAFYTVSSNPKYLGMVPVGEQPSWVIIDPKAEFAYVTSRASDELHKISMSSFEEVGRVKTGCWPQRMALV